MAMTLRPTDEQDARLAAAAARAGISKHEFALRAIDRAASEHIRKRAEYIEQIAREDAALIARLGS